MARRGKELQPTLDAQMFKPYVVELIKVGFGGGVDVDIKALKERFNGYELNTGKHFLFMVEGVVTGAGIKWSEDKEGDEHREGTLKIAVTELLSVEGLAEPEKETLEAKPPEADKPIPHDEETGEVIDAQTVDEALEELQEEGLVEKTEDGKYRATEEGMAVETDLPPKPDEVEACFGDWEENHQDCLACGDAEVCKAYTLAG